MENIQVIENLKSLLVEYTSNTETQIANNLTMIFQSFQNKSLKEDIDNYAEFVLLGASLFELKAKRLLPQDEEVDWLDEVELIKDKDLAFARLLQFKAFTEVGLALAIKVKQTEREIPAFKYYQTSSLSVKPEIRYNIDIAKFTETANEVFSRYKTIQGFSHIDKELPDLQAAIDDLLKLVDKRLNTTFEELVSSVNSSQEAVINVSSMVDVVLVVGSDTSSNTKALVSTIRNLGKESFRVNTTEEIDNLDLKDKNVAVTAGASAPDHIVQEIINKLQPNETIYFENTDETEYFPLPKELRLNITTVSNFLLELFPENKVEPVRSVNKDKQWSATEALASL
ncbi:segregation/condensation protein A [bacterium]|nr:segregation/condensation protein A [bacterium]